MVLYYVRWTVNPDLVKGKGRLKSDEVLIAFNVLCNNITDAHNCFLWHFNNEYPWHRLDISVGDGELTLTRCKIDSRKFIAKYLLVEDMRIPLNVVNPKQTFLKYANQFSLR